MRLGPPFPLGNVVILVISGMIQQHTIGSMGVYRGGCGASPPPRKEKRGILLCIGTMRLFPIGIPANYPMPRL